MVSLTHARYPRPQGEQTRAKILAVIDQRAASGEGAPVFEEIVKESKLPPRTVRRQIKWLRDSGVVQVADVERIVVRHVHVRAPEAQP